jgi:hypothetical protein
MPENDGLYCRLFYTAATTKHKAKAITCINCIFT